MSLLSSATLPTALRHFAAGAALDALRLGALLGLPVSITAHANDIFAHPRNLAEKLAAARFTTSGCRYTVDALLRDRGVAPQRTVVVGEGPLRERLVELVAELDLKSLVELAGPLTRSGVRDRLEQAAVLAMPCVIGPDGDRDSMPVVVKEALAMEVAVVASDAVGLPELVRWQWGRLHRPGDREALACALEELLALDPAQRAAMGRAGRAFVSEHCHVDHEAQRLVELITYPDAPARRAPCAAGSSRRSTATSPPRRGSRS